MYASPEYFSKNQPTETFLLHQAVQAGQVSEVQKVLADPNCDINAQNKAGETALHLAVAVGSTEMVNLLLQKEASPNVLNRQRKTALDIANELHQDKVKDLLLSKGAFTAAQMAAATQHNNTRECCIF
jgi:uncharacterized protein